MKSIIEQEQKSIYNLWQSQLYIPIYQRSFVWEDEQIESLLRIIFDDKRNNIESFLGNILVVKKDKLLEIVDGQQRMTFMFLLFVSIYELMDEIEKVMKKEVDFKKDVIRGKKEKVRNLILVDKNERSSEKNKIRIFYSSSILSKNLENCANNVLYTEKSDGSLKINKVKKKIKALIFTDNLDKKNYKIPPQNNVPKLKEKFTDLFSLYEYLERSVKFIEIKLIDEKYSTEVFERINSNSKPLTDYELFKNYIAGKLISFNSDMENMEDVESKIKDIDEIITDEKYKLDTSMIIKSLLYIKEGKIINSKFKFNILRKWYNEKLDNNNSQFNASDLYEEVFNLTNTYSSIEKDDFKDHKFSFVNKVINIYGFKQLKPLFIALFFNSGESKELLNLFLSLLSIVWYNIVFKGIVANKIESLLSRISINPISSDLLEPIKIIENLKKEDLYIDAHKNMEIEKESFSSISKNEFTKIILLYGIYKKYENIDLVLDWPNNSKKEKHFIKIQFDTLHVEHIWPRNYKSEEWPSKLNKEKSEIKKIIEFPGNKIPLFGVWNQKISNDSFIKKKPTYIEFFKDGGHIFEIKNLNFESVKESDEWDEVKIKERTEKLRIFFEEILKEHINLI